MLSTLLKWLTGGGISAIGEQLRAAYEARLKAETDEARLEADMTIRQLEARQAVLIAEQGNWLTRLIRPAFAAPFIIYNFKVIVWDKVLKLGTTDPLTPDFWKLQMVVFGAYFVTRFLEKR